MNTRLLGTLALLMTVTVVTGAVGAHEGITDVRYDVTFDATTALAREIHVEMSFDVEEGGEVVLSLPVWTPGSYDFSNFARNVRNVGAHLNGSEIRWDKADFDSWRVYPESAGRVSIEFDYHADKLDPSEAWTQEDFAFFNGTNLLLFPEGQGLDFGAQVGIHTEADWQVATGLTRGDGPGEYTADSYHELVDMPTFVGRIDVDSLRVDGRWHRLATYPEGVMQGADRATVWDQLERMMPPMSEAIGETPFDDYTTLMVFDPTFGGGSALEHSNSHLGVYNPGFRGSITLGSITAHEIFHAWNVKRIRPADMWPYEYWHAQPTELLWVSEGITDYYADLAMVRGGIISDALFYRVTEGKIGNVNNTPPVALEDASLSTWISPTDGTSSIYYDKGSLAGLMLDILIRDASDNRRSLDHVMRSLYENAYKKGHGFTEEQLWEAAREAAGGRAFDEFQDAYVDGRAAYPWSEILPLAGLDFVTESNAVARIGISSQNDDEGVRIMSLTPAGAAGEAGVQVGDYLLEIAGIDAVNTNFGRAFRAMFEGSPAGSPYDVVVQRGDETLTLQAELQFQEVTSTEIKEVADASEKALRIREGILRGRTGG